MRERYQRRMAQLRSELQEMGALCEQAIVKTCRLLGSGEGQQELIREIDLLEYEIDEKNRIVERSCIQLLLQQQPVAAELRSISAALKLITDLERIGDQAVDIAEIIRSGSVPTPVAGIGLTEMAEFAVQMVNRSVEAYVHGDLAMAQAVIESDDQLDAMFVGLRQRLGGGARGCYTNAQAMDLVMIAKYYERIGDHAVNVGEWVEFSLTGRHRSGKAVNDIFEKEPGR